MSISHIKKTLLEKARSFCYNYDVNKKMRRLRMKNDLKRAVGGGQCTDTFSFREMGVFSS